MPKNEEKSPSSREEIEINLVSEREMYERNPFLKVHLMDNPFYDPHNTNPRLIRIRMLRRGVTKKMALDLIKPLYTEETVGLISRLLDDGKTKFIIEYKEGKGRLYAE